MTTQSVLLSGLLLAFACGGDSKPAVDAGPYDVPEPAPIALSDAISCELDGDCDPGQSCFQGVCALECTAASDCEDGEACGGTGRCVPASQAGSPRLVGPSFVSVVPGLSLVSIPERIQYISPGQSTLEVRVEVAGEVPDGKLHNRRERTDGVNDTKIRHSKGQNSFVLAIPTGASADAQSAVPVHVKVITTAGSFRLLLTPRLPHQGHYGGVAVMDNLGQSGLPIEFTIVTTPDNSRLEDATSAILVLSNLEDNLFAPQGLAQATGEHLSAALEFDDFLGRWVARFENLYSLEQSSIVSLRAQSIARSLRFELEPAENGRLFGFISDRWSGLNQQRSLGNVLLPSDVFAEGRLQMQRIASVPEGLQSSANQALTHEPVFFPLPARDACTGAMIAAASTQSAVVLDGLSYDCNGISSLSEFDSVLPFNQARCAVAFAEDAMSGGTTAQEIANFLDESYTDPQGRSFVEFMADCAQGTGGTCVPSQEILCARDLLAITAVQGTFGESVRNQVIQSYREISAEVFLGRQFAAFDSDAETRLAWLEAQDYPAIVTNAVQDFMAALLDDWRDSVLNVHLEVLGQQLDEAGMAILSQEASGTASSAKHKLLFDLTQSWRGAMDALVLATGRWNTLLIDDAARQEQSSFVTSQVFDLYMSALLITNINLREGVGANNVSFGGGFGELLVESRKLDQSFNQLIFDRQGEVVVSSSLDPTRGNETILADLEVDALADVDAANLAVTAVIADAQAQALDATLLQDQMNNDIGELRDQLVELCGLPLGCSIDDYGVLSECEVQTLAGRCGFAWDGQSQVVSDSTASLGTSGAGGTILEVRQAILAESAADETIRAEVEKVNLIEQTTSAFAVTVRQLNADRMALVSQIGDQLDALAASENDSLREMAELQGTQARARESYLLQQEESIEQWDQVTINNIDTHFSEITIANRFEAAAGALQDGAEFIDETAKAAADGLPQSVGVSADASFMGRLAFRMAGLHASTAMRLTAVGLSANAERLQRKADREREYRQADLKVLELNMEHEKDALDAKVADLEAQVDLNTELRKSEREQLALLLDLMRQEQAASEAEARDLIDLRDRQLALQIRIADFAGLQIQALQAALTVEQRIAEYSRIVQRAGLLSARLAVLENQRTNINQLIGSPAVVFAWANRLTRAELRLETAKQRMMDWLVALEYFAVRPFMDQRIQILLARNTTQLEAIAGKLRDIQASCGGAVNDQRVEISLRDDVLRYRSDTLDSSTGRTLSPAARFRALLETANMPVDKRIRYSTDSSIGDLVSRGGVMAMTFSLSVDSFANVANTCNAKLAGLSVQLVGEGLGSALPTVSILYDGTSLIRSCQPDIAEIVDALGRQATIFDEVTQFRTPGRSISPIASINEFDPNDSPNITLGGLPLVSQYTVLIDPSTGENTQIDWTALEDIRLQVDYTFQDLFPAGQCQ